MALVLEDGSQVVNSNSYISAADATTYISNYNPSGLDVWPTDQPSQEAALLIAAQALEIIYAERYISERLFGLQNMLWPRYTFWDRNNKLVQMNTIPKELGYAQAELAILSLQGVDLFPNMIDEGYVIEDFTKVDSIETRKRYKTKRDYIQFPKVDLVLRAILKPKFIKSMAR